MNDRLAEELAGIISSGGIGTVFQPIVSLRNGSTVGYEALSRISRPGEISGAEELFRLADEAHRLWDLERLCRARALSAASRARRELAGKKLFLNVNPNVLHDAGFRGGFTREYLRQYGLTPADVVFEITERTAVPDVAGFRDAILHYRDQGYGIALDDVGSGYSRFDVMTEVRPDFIKLDMQLIRDVDSQRIKLALVRSLVDFARTSRIGLVAEGIETGAELTTLVELGVQYGQGFFLRRPGGEPADTLPEARQVLATANRRKNHLFGGSVASIYIEHICTATETVAPSASVEEIFDRLRGDGGSVGLCVVEDGAVLGVVTAQKLVAQLSGRYGFALNHRRRIASMMDRDFLSVDHQMPIGVVSRMAMDREPSKMYDFLVVTEDDRFLGTVTVKDLLQRTTEIEVVNAKFENPLTGLPGNLVIERRMQLCVEDDSPYSVIYFDIDNFKAYNDVYGFESGDRVIKLLADLLTFYLPEGQFAGHVGGDDFVVVLDDREADDYCDSVMREFDARIPQYYKHEDVRKGYIRAENRHGAVEEFPLISLSVAGVDNGNRHFSSLHELTAELARLKKRSKQQAGSSRCWLRPAAR